MTGICTSRVIKMLVDVVEVTKTRDCARVIVGHEPAQAP